MKRTPIIPIKWINEQHDTDQDGVPNYRDCNILNPHKHIFGKEKKAKCKECKHRFPISQMHKIHSAFGGGYICKDCQEKKAQQLQIDREWEVERKKLEKESDRRYEEKSKRMDELLRCQNCGKVFRVSLKNQDPRCPRCGEGDYLSFVKYIPKRRRR